MAFNNLQKVRNNTTNKSLAHVVSRRVTGLIRRFSAFRSSSSSSSQVAINSQLAEVVADMNRANHSDPPEGNTYDLVGHVQTSKALMLINNRIDMVEAQLQSQQATSSQAEQVTSPISFGDSSAPQESPTSTLRPLAPADVPIATVAQRSQPRRQDSIPFLDLGATLSPVYIAVQGARTSGSRAAEGDGHRPLEVGSRHGPDHMMPRGHLDGRHGLEIKEAFGMNGLWRYVAHHMLWNFVLGYICLVLSVIIWVFGKESKELIIPIVVVAVGTAFPVYGLLRFMVPF